MNRRTRVAAAAIAIVAMPTFTPPTAVGSEPAPDRVDLTAEAWIVYDVDADLVLASERADEERPMASVTKIMTALVVIENADLDEKVRISESAAATGEAEIGLVPGERWAVRDLLAAVMVRSGNDAAVALAEYVGGSVEGFADLMNEKAAALGLEHTHFVNPHGLDDEGHYTSAADLLVMARLALADPYLARLARTKLITFRPDPSGVARRARNTNRLLGAYPGVVGLKTGFTGLAGKVLVSALERNDRTLLAVVMGSEDHFRDSRELLDWAYSLPTLEARFLAPLVAEQGGGGPTPGVRLDRATRLRLSVPQDLPDGQWAVTPFRASPLGREIEAWLRGALPVTLGGVG
jgi:D-alanyl-D-alanine carboxypeptidase